MVNCPIKSKYRNRQGKGLSNFCLNAHEKGLRSENMTKFHPSDKYLKCFTLAKATNNSL